MIINGDALTVLKGMQDKSVHCVVTSSPYFGLRNYGTDPIVWDGDPNCQHEWEVVHPPGYRGSDTNPGPMQHEGNKNRQNLKSDFCNKCGAWKGELGLEPTPELFIKHLTDIYREVRRVLRDDGCFWANIGDSYWGSGNAAGHKDDTKNLENTTSEYGATKGHTCQKSNTFKPKDLIEIPSMLAASLRADGWYLRARLPWIKRNCLASGTVVYTRSQKGVMPSTIHDLMRLEPQKVELWNGNKWTRVIDMHQTEDVISDGMVIELRSGEKITCTKEHRWPTKRGLLPSENLIVGDIIEKTTLPDTDNNIPKFIPDEIGRIIGLFLAEGSYLTINEDDGIIFTLSKKETHLDKEIKKFALDYGGSHHSHTYEGDGKLMSVVHGKIPISLVRHFISNKGSKLKRLSNACWSRNNMFLKNLLMGYLEGDGHNDSMNHRWRLGFSENNHLAQDIRILCARLGISLRLKRGECSAIKGGKLYQIWRGQIRFNQINRSINDTCFKHAEDTEIVSINRAKSQHFYDIGVEDEPHLFALASGVLTHNSLPSSVTDRPSSSIEYVFLLTKSGDTTYWTHPTECGTRKKPDPDYIYINKLTGEVTKLLQTGDDWKRKNLWTGHDYFYDHIATMQPSSESYNKDKRPRGTLRQCVNPNSKYPDEGQFKKQDGTGNPTTTGFNARYAESGKQTQLRFMRDSDFFFKTWQGILHNENGEPMALVVNPKGYKGAHFACVDTETECLTISGWKRHDQIREGTDIFTYNMKTGNLEIQPTKGVISYRYTGDLVSVFGRSSNMLMTPNHRCVVTTRDKKIKGGRHPAKIVEAANLKGGMKFPVAAKLSFSPYMVGIELPEFYELLGWIISEGYFKDTGLIGINQSLSANPEKCKRITSLLEQLKITYRHYTKNRLYKEKESIECEWHITGWARAKIHQMIPDKYRIPEYFLLLPDDHINAFLRGFVGGDGHIRPDARITIQQKEKQPLDIIQAMFLRMGKSCILSQRGNGHWSAFITSTKDRCFKDSKESLVDLHYSYDGVVWCPTVDNGTWVARRGGRPFITGNCFPIQLVEPMILASTSEMGVCPMCGAPLVRVVEKKSIHYRPTEGSGEQKGNISPETVGGLGDVGGYMCVDVQTTGWSPTCNCEHDLEPIGATVLDPLSGSSATGVAAELYGRKYIGIELNPKYCELGEERLRSGK